MSTPGSADAVHTCIAGTKRPGSSTVPALTIAILGEAADKDRIGYPQVAQNCRSTGEPLAIAVCHCRNCRRQSGSAFSVNVVVCADAMELTGELTTYEDRDTASGAPVTR
jgi:hypothetical protein